MSTSTTPTVPTPSVFTDARLQLAADLGVIDAPVFASWPVTIDLPCIYVLPPLGDIYVSAGPNFQEFTVLLDVVILAQHDDVTASLQTIETLLADVLRNAADWTLRGVEPPAPITVTESGADYLGVVLHLSKPVTLK